MPEEYFFANDPESAHCHRSPGHLRSSVSEHPTVHFLVP
jgi:hypothetical protein